MHNLLAFLLSMIAFPRAAFAQQAGVVTAPPVHESSKSYTGPIFDVHLHTDPPIHPPLRLVCRTPSLAWRQQQMRKRYAMR
jgi:hypothetical protein